MIMIPREMPLHEVHLENMLTLSRLGAVMAPAMPAFYHKPRSVEELVNFVVGKVLDLLEIEHQLFRRWGE
jgi:4-hydroxy-3-polyprenylbenzoate decarboxylase